MCIYAVSIFCVVCWPIGCEGCPILSEYALHFRTKANPMPYRAYLLKENLRLALKASPLEIVVALEKWMSWAQRCRIPVFRELRMKIKLVIRKAYGVRNLVNLLAMVMLSCSDVCPCLPRR